MKEPKIYITNRYADNRGYFKESRPNYIMNDLSCSFVQENLSFSKKGTIRGLHYQWQPDMGKLISVISGSIIDIIVDIREDSLNLGKVYYYKLSSEGGEVLWVPPGFAHGFEALEDSYVQYGCTTIYSSETEGSINVYDNYLNINLQTPREHVIISERDKKSISFKEYCQNFKF